MEANCDACQKSKQDSSVEVYYLARSKRYQEEKPYMIAFDSSSFSGPKTNHVYSKHTISVEDARPCKKQFTLDSHGFQFAEHGTRLRNEDFDNDDTVRCFYYPEIRELLSDVLPSIKYVHIFAHLRRKRRIDFELPAAEEPKFADPIVYAHADFTPHGAEEALKTFFLKNEELRSKPMSIINVWRVTKGPNNDWPLALCDFRSLERSDIEANDVIHRDHVGESVRVHHNPNHRWHYLSNQSVDEVVLFRNTDSRAWDIPFAIHLALPSPKAKSHHTMRESIEVRVACFW